MMNFLRSVADGIKSKVREPSWPKLGVKLILLGGVPLKLVSAIGDKLGEPNLDRKALSALVQQLTESLDNEYLTELIDKLTEYLQHTADQQFSEKEIEEKTKDIQDACQSFVSLGLNAIMAVYLAATAVLLIGLCCSANEIQSSDKKFKLLSEDIRRKITACEAMIRDLDTGKEIFTRSMLDKYSELIKDVISLKKRVEIAKKEAFRNKAYAITGAVGGVVLAVAGGFLFVNAAQAVGLTIGTGIIGFATVANGVAACTFGYLVFKVDQLQKDLELLDKDLDKLIHRLSENELINIAYDAKTDKYTYTPGDKIRFWKEKSKQFWDENGNIDDEKVDELQKENAKLKSELQEVKKRNSIDKEEYAQFLAWKKEKQQNKLSG